MHTHTYTYIHGYINEQWKLDMEQIVNTFDIYSMNTVRIQFLHDALTIWMKTRDQNVSFSSTRDLSPFILDIFNNFVFLSRLISSWLWINSKFFLLILSKLSISYETV